MSTNIGKLIVIDGIDGSGKATQTKILHERLEKQGLEVQTIDFPQYNKNFFGGLVRQYLDGKFGEPTKVDPKLASVLYAADRWESSEIIKDWLTQGKIVIIDRYYTSNLIHQSAKLTEPEIDDFITWLHELEMETFKIPEPNLVVFLHVDAQTSFDLITKRGEGHDGHDTIEHLKIAEKRCLYLANKLKWLTIECCEDNHLLDIEKISNKIWLEIQPLLTRLR